jgi:hypothetical protein
MQRRSAIAAFLSALCLNAQIAGTPPGSDLIQYDPGRGGLKGDADFTFDGSVLSFGHTDEKTGKYVYDLRLMAVDKEFGHQEIHGKDGLLVTIWKDGYVSGNASEALRLLVFGFTGRLG